MKFNLITTVIIINNPSFRQTIYVNSSTFVYSIIKLLALYIYDKRSLKFCYIKWFEIRHN